LRTENEYIDDLLGKYLAGEASELETSQVTSWIEQSDANKRYFEQIRKVFEGATSLRGKEYDTDAAWNKVRDNLKRPQGRAIPFTPQRTFDAWWKIAAAVLITVSIGIYLIRSSEQTNEPIQLVTQKQAVSDTLPGGTNVFLNKSTRLEYAFDEKTKLHDVKLEGEAYFNVHKKKKEKFIVKAGEVFIRDIGTSFNVKAYPGSDIVEVLVEEGEIVFYTADNPGIHLKESGKGVYNRKTKQFTIDQPEPNITSYKTKFFYFSETTLEEAVESLNAVYETPIVIGDNLRNCPITVSFRNESIDEVAAVIAETLGLTVVKENDRIILNGRGCE
jgi:transmembrane sensor